MRTLFIGDNHFFHLNCIVADGRPFDTVEDMNEHMIACWNEAVTPKDRVYVLGDFAWANSTTRERLVLPTLQRLKGNLTLIRGNHDRLITPEYCGLFDDVKDYLITDVCGYKCVLFHYPIAKFWHQMHGAIHIYAHMHNQPTPCDIPWSVCVSACRPYMNYAPRTLGELWPYIVKPKE